MRSEGREGEREMRSEGREGEREMKSEGRVKVGTKM